MNQSVIGNFITQKRKEKNLTQAQLAQILGISNKTISKWETGRCMPDYSIIKKLCEELGITLSELMDGEEEKESIRVYDDEQIVELLKRIQNLEQQKNILYGILLITMGIALLAVSQTFGGSDVKDFLSGTLLGISIGEMLAGVYVTARYYFSLNNAKVNP